MATMIKEGTVLENNNGNLTVSIARNEACGACAAKGSCGQKSETIIEIFSADDIKKGDRILLESKSSDITKYSMYVYILPVILMILGATLPNILLKDKGLDLNLLTLLSIVIFMALSFFIVKGIDRKIKDDNVMKVRKI